MLSPDPLTNLSQAAGRIRHEAQGRMFTAALRPGDPAGRAREAQAIRDAAQTALERVRAQFTGTAPEQAEQARRSLFDLSRNVGPGARRDPYREHAEWADAVAYAAKINSDDDAVAAIAHGLALYGRDRSNGIQAGAVALRAHEQGWGATVTHWCRSVIGQQRGGEGALERLKVWEAACRGDLPPVFADLPSAQEWLGDRWPVVAPAG